VPCILHACTASYCRVKMSCITIAQQQPTTRVTCRQPTLCMAASAVASATYNGLFVSSFCGRELQPGYYRGNTAVIRRKTAVTGRPTVYGKTAVKGRHAKASRPMWPRGQIIRPQPRPHSFWSRGIWPRPHRNWSHGLEYLQCT